MLKILLIFFSGDQKKMYNIKMVDRIDNKVDNNFQEEFNFQDFHSSSIFLNEMGKGGKVGNKGGNKSDEYNRLSKRTPIILQKLLDNCGNFKCIISILKDYNFKYRVSQFSIVIFINDEKYLVDKFDCPILKKI